MIEPVSAPAGLELEEPVEQSLLIDEVHVDDLPFLDFDSSDAPPMAVNDAALASVAAATRDILADATPLPRPRPQKPVVPLDPEIPLFAHDLELPPPSEKARPDAASVEIVSEPAQESIPEVTFPADVSDASPMTLTSAAPIEEPILFEPQTPEAPPLLAEASPATSGAPPSDPHTRPPELSVTVPVADADPFFGMSRDLVTFLGGMPLDLSGPPPAVTSLFAPSTVPSAPVTPVLEIAADIVVAAEAASSGASDDSEKSISNYLANAEEPQQDLFESTPDSLDSLPDSMRPIRDVVEVLGEHPGTGASEAPSAAPAPPAVNKSDQLFTPGSVSSAASPRAPAGHLPPRPRLPNRSLAASPFDFGSQPVADVTIPALGGGSPASGQITTEFDGLAISDPLEPDAFEHSRPQGESFIPPVDPSRKGSGMLTALSASPPAAVSPRMRPDAEIPRRPRGVGVPAQDRRGPRHGEPPTAVAALSPRRSGQSPSPQFDGLPPVPPTAPLNLHLRVLLPIIVALALATAAGIWFFYRVNGTAQGRLRFDNLENLRPSDKRAFEVAQQQLLRRPDVRDFARRLFESHNDGKPDVGFLSQVRAEDNQAYESLLSAVAIDPKSSQLLLTTNGSDPEGDARRLWALVQTLYRENQHLGDDSASARRAYLQSRDAVEATAAQINRLTPALQEEQDAANQLASAQQTLEQNKAKTTALWQAWNEAARQLHAAQAEEDRLDDVAVAAPGGVPAGSSPAVAGADADPQLKDLSDQLAAATESLTQTRVAHSSAADEANKALDQALADFRERINAAQGSLKDGSQLSAYLTAAQQAQDTIRQLNADLVERQKSEQQRLADLRRVLAEKQETRLKAAWAADSQLQEMDQDLSVAEHRYNAAVGSGLDADAATLKTEVESLKNRIDARRDLIGTGDIYADEVKSLQQFIDDSLKGMETDRARADMRMGEMLKALSAAAPQMEKLPADQQALEESLNKQLDEINSARQLQAEAVAAANPEADAAVKKLEASITELQAKMDARRKQLAEDSHKQLTTQQAQERAAALERAKAGLTAAQMEEAEASASVRANKEQTDAAYSSVEGLRAKAANLAADTAHLSDLQSQLPDLKSRSEQLLADWQRIPVPQAPSDDCASATVVHDPRLQWILISMLGYAMLTAGTLAVWGVSHRQHHLRLTSSNDRQTEELEDTGLSEHADVLEPRGPAPIRDDDEI